MVEGSEEPRCDGSDPAHPLQREKDGVDNSLKPIYNVGKAREQAMVPAEGRTARLTVDPDFVVGDVDRRLFGSFVEHMGRSVYTGIYEPGHPSADVHGNRGDVIELARELGVTAIRYPGGNFVSGYRWEDGVGPVDRRPSRLDLAWRAVEPNTFGLDEFMRWVRLVGAEPIMAVNLGTRGPAEAAELLEYCNHPGGTELSDRRRANGTEQPHGIRLWCLGNEMDGPWQIGAKSATEYGRLAAETAKVMRLVDPDVELVACGSSMASMPSFATWEAQVLDECIEHVDHLSMHAYYEEHDGDTASLLATGVEMDRAIDDVVATIDHVAARRRSTRRPTIAFDEWNVWSQRSFAGVRAQSWESPARLIEDDYDVAAAVAVGSYLMSLLRHCDRVRIACQAQLTNVIAPIRTEPGGPAWRQTTFHPFALTAAHARGVALRVEPVSPEVRTALHGAVPALDAAATHDADSGVVSLFLVNRSLEAALPVEVSLHGLPVMSVGTHQVIAADGDVRRRNTATAPDRVVPRPGADARTTPGCLQVTLPAASWSVLTLHPDDPT
jgi:alpha-L-arabinofuranosidase